MNQFRSILPMLAAGVLIASGCDTGTGLAPLNEPSGFSGVISFKNWPPPDSVQELRVVAFESYPTDSSGILVALLSGRAVVYPQIGQKGLRQYLDTLHYEFTDKGTNLQAKLYGYVAVAWKYGSNIFVDWRPAGVYTTTPGTFQYAPVRVLTHRITPDINIDVDFHNPPPRPW